MSILPIRKHQRFAVLQKVVAGRTGGTPGDALLIELSLRGCRLGEVDGDAFCIGQSVTVAIEGFGELEGEVRWTGGERVGLHLVQALHVHELDNLLRLCRGSADGVSQRRTATG